MSTTLQSPRNMSSTSEAAARPASSAGRPAATGATETLMGDEAIALGALHAGLSSAYAYPGTPSTEIMESFQSWKAAREAPACPSATMEALLAEWCSNEKTAYESALGASFAGRRAIVSMKHVGLNVAADPFVNSALIRINGGLVVVVADDPGMHSSQDEQDTRVLADFARLPCFEPANQQEAYDMTRAAFDFSEAHEVPVVIRITTRLAHSRSIVDLSAARAPNPLHKAEADKSWILMPAIARRRWKVLLGKQAAFLEHAEGAARLEAGGSKLGVIACGIARQYLLENLEDLTAQLGERPTILTINSYPVPVGRIRELAARVGRILVLEDGFPHVEDMMRGVFGAPVPVEGRRSGALPLDGELSPDLVRTALGLPARKLLETGSLVPPERPPQFCQGCPHGDSYSALKEALKPYPEYSVNSDIGCYTLGALPPWNAIDSCVDMGASVGMARGAAGAGMHPAVAVIGDSTFYHSGLPNLVDAVSHNTNITLVILDNDTTGMTGAQPTIAPASRLEPLLRGVGVDPAHIRQLRAHRTEHEANVRIIGEELAHEGPSVIIMIRECIEWAKKTRNA
ncbi:MAG TPA: thiamine pyrophosphate-dependent enzyme [Rectinemataceae bacterium]|nr:thiamine pyrophosphate-dependent enzyme [Rectinemataceae bacterium]